MDARNLDVRFAPPSRVSAARFTTYTGDEIRKISCKKITNPNTFDSLLHPNLGGLYDPALGPIDKTDVCGTCGLNYVHCPGHMGHITLPLPVYHPLFFMSLYQLVRGSCWNCHRMLSTPVKAHLLRGQLQLVECGLLSEAVEVESNVLMGETAQADEIVEDIAKYVTKHTAKAGKVSRPTKNLTEFRRHLISEFVKQCTKTTKCPHCSLPVRSTRHENKVRVFLKGLAKKHASAWAEALNKEAAKRKAEWEAKEGSDAGTNTDVDAVKPADCCLQQYVTVVEVREHMREVWRRDRGLVAAVCGADLGLTANGMCPLEMFFMDVVPVPPSRFRPISRMGDRSFENPQSTNLTKILNDSIAIFELMNEKVTDQPAPTVSSRWTFSERLQSAWTTLQLDVNMFMDSQSDKRIKDAPSGIRQILEKKEGLFRMHMMGKRVDFAARSVISPDPYINMDEIGIPMVFATKLTYPQPVTHWNINEVRQAVINGPNIHPGATHVQNEDGSVILLNPHNPRQRQAIAFKLLAPGKEGDTGGATKKVFRHLKTGDVLLLNRQPTLHKPSIMAHKARVLPGEKTLRLHYANCKSYNADFDGDEMNAHFPQNELARSEAYNIVSTHNQYLVPKDGTPLSGLIQDHVVAGVLMTIRGRMFSRADYMNLVFSAVPSLRSQYKTLPPCILKPERLWSGKQVVSTLLLNITPDDQYKLNLVSKTKIAPKEWSRGAVKSSASKKKKKKSVQYHDDIMTESEVIFREGELLSGVLDKSQFGASQFGFVHCIYELYNGEVCNLLLSALGRLFTSFLQLHGFSLGLEDILVKPEADLERRKAIVEARSCGAAAAAECFGTSPDDLAQIREKYEGAHHSRDSTALKTLDFVMKKKTDQYNNIINSVCVPDGLYKPFPHNSLQLMVQSGSKGSAVNCMQISALLGQMELEGQRPPLMPSGQFLPSFRPYDISPRAGGFVDERFLTGVRPQEYFFHCMAGREGLVDTAVKTSRSGYLQRCLIKHMEGVIVNYDLTVRDSDGSVIQFLYGEDGLDIGKTRFLSEKLFPFLVDNYKALLHKLDPSAASAVLESTRAPKYLKKLDHWAAKHGGGTLHGRPRRSAFLHFYSKHLPEAELKASGRSQQADSCRTKAQLKVIEAWYGLSPMSKESLRKKCLTRPDPINASLRQDRFFGSAPEALMDKLKSFIEKNPSKLRNIEGDSSEVSGDKFTSLVQLKCLRALADPGEAVGLLAAQSIGEPSTQMTLNTFHFAGRGEMNVTLGIPRLREILMTASANIKTPAMDVPLLPRPDAREQGEKLKKFFTRVCLSEVLENLEVWESLEREGKGHVHQQYRLRFSFLPQECYDERFSLKPSHILHYMERMFIKKLVAAIKKEMKNIKEKRMKALRVERDKHEAGGAGGDGDGEDGAGGGGQQEAHEGEHSDAEGEEEVSEVEEEADVTAAKALSKKQEYDNPGESDEEIIQAQGSTSEDEMDDDDGKVQSNEQAKKAGDSDEEPTEGSTALDESQDGTPVLEKTFSMNQDRVQEVLQNNSVVSNYTYDAERERWCEMTLKFPSVDSKIIVTSIVEKLAPKCVVWEVPGIRKGYLMESTDPGEKGLLRLKTDGINLQVLWQYADILDLRKLYTNHIHAVAKTYGIEAAVKTIIKEISGVFRVYGIDVDYRHLSLIADYMTFEGSYKPFNRTGMEANSSPFQKMSFETTMHFLKSATLNGDVDTLASPSARIVAGRVVQGGTGCFELFQSLC